MAEGSPTLEAFDWVDDYFAHVRPHFEVREEDRLLIALPNQAVKLNPSGLAILRFLKGGGAIRQLLDQIGPAPERRSELLYFLCDFRSLMSGRLGEGRERKAVHLVAHCQPFNTLPVLSEIAVTYRCNLRCQFCYAACGCQGPSGLPMARELPTRTVIRLLGVIRRAAKVPSVSFTGGEPTLRKDLVELVAAAKRIGLRTNLITNGTLIDANLAGRLREAGLASAQVSLEGPIPSVHDVLTGVPGSFARTMAGLEAPAPGRHPHSHQHDHQCHQCRFPGSARGTAGRPGPGADVCQHGHP